MAIFTPGPMAGTISGSIGGTTFSHNKGGAYIRNRGIPTNPNSPTQLLRRAALATESQAWQLLTDAQRQSWEEWADQNPIKNGLGQTILKTGHQSFIGINTRIHLAGGTHILVPPIIPAAPAFVTLVQDGDIGTGDLDLEFTAALESGNQVELWAAVTNSQGITNVENKYRFISFSPVDQSTPWDNESDIVSVLGTLSAGQKLHVKAAQYDPATGLRSEFLRDSIVITDTP